ATRNRGPVGFATRSVNECHGIYPVSATAKSDWRRPKANPGIPSGYRPEFLAVCGPSEIFLG
ncbi:MAG: hypothetical protein ACP5I8_11830, partial [Phycisphaerae bacterium]